MAPLFKHLSDQQKFFDRLSLKPLYLIIPALLALFGSLCEGISVSLLVPLAKAVVQMNVSLIGEVGFLQPILRYFSVLETRNAFLFILLVSLIFFFAITKNVFQYASSLTGAFFVRKFANNLRKMIYCHYLSFNKLFFDRHNTGHLHHVLMHFTHQTAHQLIEMIHVLNYLFMLIVYLIIMSVISWKLTLLSLCIFPILHFSMKWLIYKIEMTSDFYAQSQSDLSKKIFNVLTCIPLVKAYSREDQEMARFGQTSDLLQGLQVSIDKKRELIQPVQEIIMLLAILALIAFMSFMVVHDRQHEAIGGYLVFFYVIRRAAICFGTVNRLRSSLAVMKGPMGEIRRMLEKKNKYTMEDGSVEFMGLRSNITFEHLTFSYDSQSYPVLKDISFSIERGKMTAIVGPTGAGKSTLVHLLMRFYPVPHNSLKVDGEDISSFSVKSLRSKISMVSQDALLFNDTLRNNLTYGLEGPVKEEELIDVVKKARLYDFIMSLPNQFETFIGDRGVRLSGGEKQRVSIARALLKGSEILILDEATSALDTATEKLIQQALETLVENRTTIVIAHRLSTIRNADNIIVLESGRLVEQGHIDDLLRRKERFFEFWEHQRFD